MLDYFQSTAMSPKGPFPDQTMSGLPRQQTTMQETNFNDKSFKTIEPLQPNSLLEMTKRTIQPPENETFIQDVNRPQFNSIDPNSRQDFNQTAPALRNFHITDLLSRSIFMGSKEREPNKLRQIIDFYKRSVKNDSQINSKKEILI
mmetsp:Transcript_42576/g.65314  ORF Transcript_42576/g.65314 Transcript_42576/m.65314 type:complete len:146 (-) Transcript_42576:19-456(-)